MTEQPRAASPRMPYGYARRIVAALREGEAVTVRATYIVQMHNAARRMGRRLTTAAIEKNGETMFRMMLRIEGAVTGHQLHRPKQDDRTGRWRKAA